MNFYKFFFVILFLTITFQLCIAQETKATLLDEFGATNCCDEGARLDGLAIHLQENPNSKGFVVIYFGENTQPIRKFFQENWVKNYLYISRGIDKNRIEFLRGAEKDKYQIQLWITDDISKKPEFIGSKWDYILPNKRAYQFYSSKDDGGPCNSPFSIELFVNFLSANSNKRGHIVIIGSSAKELQKTKTELSKELFDKYNIPQKRIKFFFVKDNDYLDYTTEEYWFVRPKK